MSCEGGLTRLAGTVAHEFNNVLMGIQPFAELLKRPNLSDETLAKCAHHIDNSIQRGKRVALEILKFTQPAPPNLKPLRINEWLARLVPEIEAQCDNLTSVVYEIPEESPVVLIDGGQIAQVITNVANNARDAMPRGGTITIRVREPHAGEVLVSVTDTGTGIDAKVLPHIFEPMFTTKKNAGLGLGLAVAQQVVGRHGGRIFAESTPGAGTAVHVFLPTVRTE